MTVTIATLLAALAVWMLICGWCGFRKRFLMFFAVLLLGLALNLIWMVVGLNAQPFGPNALIAELSATLYALGAFGSGWLIGRLVREFQASRID